MKNLPEKIYAYIPEDDIVGTASTKKGVPHQYVDIEYVRKDTFIEKADEFISTFFHPDDTELIDAVLNRFHEHMKLK